MSSFTHATASAEPRGKLIALGIVLPLLSTAFVVLRLLTRRRASAYFSLDDGFIIAGLVLVWGMGITQAISASKGNLGQKIDVLPTGGPDLSSDESIILLQSEWAFQIIEKLAFGAIKLSIILFYRRVFVGRVFNLVTWAMMTIVFVWSMSFFWTTVFKCKTDFAAEWSTNRDVQLGSCLPDPVFLIPFAWSDIVTDILILIIPIPIVLRLHMPPRKKIVVLAIFILGFLTVLAGVARLVFFYRATEDQHGADVPINMAPTFYWSLVEASVAIVAACLPLLRPVFQGFSPESVLGSLREMISLRSLRRSGGSSRTQEPALPSHKQPKSKEKPHDGSQESRQAQHRSDSDTGGAIYSGPSSGQLWTEAEGTGKHNEPDGEIRVTKTVALSVELA